MTQDVQIPLDYPHTYPPPPQEYTKQPHNEYYKGHEEPAFGYYVKWALIGVVGLTGIGIGMYYLTRRHVSRKEEIKTLDKENPASIAKMFKIGFDNNGWPGADMETVRQAVRAIPDQATLKKVAASYQKLPGGNVFASDLEEYLYGSEYTEIKAILDSLPEKAGSTPQKIYDPYGWARRLHAGVTYETWGFMWGTDIDAINLVLSEVPTQKAWEDVKAAYAEIYPGYTLDEDLQGDGVEKAYYEGIIKRKPYA